MANEANFYFSQTGEDTVLKFLLRDRKDGVYVDIGCNTPIYFSNTFYPGGMAFALMPMRFFVNSLESRAHLIQ